MTKRAAHVVQMRGGVESRDTMEMIKQATKNDKIDKDEKRNEDILSETDVQTRFEEKQ